MLRFYFLEVMIILSQICLAITIYDDDEWPLPSRKNTDAIPREQTDESLASQRVEVDYQKIKLSPRIRNIDPDPTVQVHGKRCLSSVIPMESFAVLPPSCRDEASC